MTEKVSSRSVACASCSVLQTAQTPILRRITVGQPTITRLLKKMSVVPLQSQTKMPNRCTKESLEKGIRPFPVEPKILGRNAVAQAQEIGLHPALVGSPMVKKIQMAPPVAEIEIQAKPPNPAETKEMPKGPRARAKEKLSGASRSGKGKGRGGGGGRSSGGRGHGRGNHPVDQVSGADQVTDADKGYIKIALNPADDPFHEEWIDESGYIHQVDVAAAAQKPGGATKIAPPQAISGMLLRFLLDPHLM